VAEPPIEGHDSMEPTSIEPESMDIDEIQATIPHRYPFLLVDRISRVEICCPN